MRSFVALGVVSLMVAAGMVACGDDDSSTGPSVGGSGGTGGGNGGTSGGGTGGGGTGGGGTGGTGGAGGTGGGTQLPPAPVATCAGCVQLTTAITSPLPTGATQAQAGWIFVAAAPAAPFDLTEVTSITWRIQALNPNALYFVQPFVQNAPPEGSYDYGSFPPSTALTPAAFPAGEWRDVTIDIASLNPVAGDAGVDAGEPPVVEVADAGDAGAGVTITAFDKTYTRQIGLNVGAQATAPLGWVGVAVDSVTVNGTSNFTSKTFTVDAEGLLLNNFQTPTGTTGPTFR